MHNGLRFVHVHEFYELSVPAWNISSVFLIEIVENHQSVYCWQRDHWPGLHGSLTAHSPTRRKGGEGMTRRCSLFVLLQKLLADKMAFHPLKSSNADGYTHRIGRPPYTKHHTELDQVYSLSTAAWLTATSGTCDLPASLGPTNAVFLKAAIFHFENMLVVPCFVFGWVGGTESKCSDSSRCQIYLAHSKIVDLSTGFEGAQAALHGNNGHLASFG